MTLEPRLVKSGYAKRWCQQAFELVVRSFHLWFGLYFALSLLLAVVPFGGLLAIPVGIFSYALSCELAALSDRGALTGSVLLERAKHCAQYCAQTLWRIRLALGLAMVLSFLLVLGAVAVSRHAQAPAVPRAPADYHSIWTWLVGPDSPFLNSAVALWVGSFMAAGFARRLPMLRYCLVQWSSESAADVALDKTAHKNLMPSFFLEMLHMACLGVAVLIAPCLAPFLTCFLPAVTYVAFREMFIDDQGNRSLASRTSSTLASVPTASS